MRNPMFATRTGLMQLSFFVYPVIRNTLLHRTLDYLMRGLSCPSAGTIADLAVRDKPSGNSTRSAS